MAEAILITIEARNTGDRQLALDLLERLLPEALAIPARFSSEGMLCMPITALRRRSAASGLAPVPDCEIERDTDTAVLSHLLYISRTDGGEQYDEVLYRVHHGQGTEGDVQTLELAGMRHVTIERKGKAPRAYLAINPKHSAIATAFANSPWASTQASRLRRIKGVETGKVPMGCGHTNCVLIPMDLISGLIPEIPF